MVINTSFITKPKYKVKKKVKGSKRGELNEGKKRRNRRRGQRRRKEAEEEDDEGGKKREGTRRGQGGGGEGGGGGTKIRDARTVFGLAKLLAILRIVSLRRHQLLELLLKGFRLITKDLEEESRRRRRRRRGGGGGGGVGGGGGGGGGGVRRIVTL